MKLFAIAAAILAVTSIAECADDDESKKIEEAVEAFISYERAAFTEYLNKSIDKFENAVKTNESCAKLELVDGEMAKTINFRDNFLKHPVAVTYSKYADEGKLTPEQDKRVLDVTNEFEKKTKEYSDRFKAWCEKHP